MTTLPPNYLRLSSKWLETNPLPEDGLLLEADDTWKPSSQRGRITATPGFDYATARTDLPREAYADSEPGAEVASERAEDTNAELAMLRDYVGSSYLLSDFQNVQQMRDAIATLRAQLDAKDAESRELRESNAVLQSQVDNADVNLEQVRLIEKGKNDKLRAEVEELKAQVERKSDAALGYAQENTRLRVQLDAKEAEVEHRAKQRDEFQNLFIEASDGFNQRGEQLARLTAELDAVRKENDWRKTTLKNREETLNKVSNDVVIARTERDAAHARCGDLERGLNNIRETFKVVGNIGRIERLIDSLLTPSQQPDNFDSSSTEGRAERVANRRGVTMPERGSSENQSSPAVTPSRPESVKAGEEIRVDRPWSEYPIGTKAPAITGGAWTRVKHGWKWGSLQGGGGVFPTPGGDNTGYVILPPIAPEGKATEGEG